MASLEGLGLQAPSWLLSAEPGGYRAFGVPQLQGGPMAGSDGGPSPVGRTPGAGRASAGTSNSACEEEQGRASWRGIRPPRRSGALVPPSPGWWARRTTGTESSWPSRAASRFAPCPGGPEAAARSSMPARSKVAVPCPRGTRSLPSTPRPGGQVTQPGAGVDEVLVVAGGDVDARSFVLRSRCPPNDTDNARDDGRQTATRTVRAVTSPVGRTCRGLPQR
jgi:hypothetical protein